MVKLLVEHGAPVNGFDDKGNTALYYTCSRGLQDSFLHLIDEGAEFMTKHKLSAKRRHQPTPQPQEPTFDLMQVALHALNHSTIVQNSIKRAYRCWARIILFFINAHFDSGMPDNIFTELVETACRTGDIEAASTFLHYDERLNVGKYGSGRSAVLLAPALKSAARKGRVEIAKLLLRFGADPRIVCQDTRQSGRLGRREQPGDLGEKNHNIEKTAIAAVCEEIHLTDVLKPRPPSILDACELLFRKGVSDTDQRRILARASLDGRLQIVQRLWSAGVRVDKVPSTTSVEVLHFFYTHHECFD
jgi:ankyrin repeat protein